MNIFSEIGRLIGDLISGIVNLFDAKKDYRILMIGLDNAGKTTILYRLKIAETVSTIPTIGFNVETINYRSNINFTVWDVGGQSRIRSLWRHYYQNSNAIIFVLDSTDRDRMTEVKEEIDGLLLEECLKGVPILLLSNKQDLPGSLNSNEISTILNLYAIKDRKWYIQPTCGINGDGLYEGFDFITKSLRDNK
ncbi:ADP-ribosylation factor-related protein [Tieghemostelium lacteum]|uniref:ADP-ribosylation factor-related protein n=1 Tax=Tieghemostelium lacteum TaxID=361077 RepID=A0A152A9T3_TIELA|nr:ADP-ribosylation factor-related protein [Tieghemostelium lacteum]|eukprot:KYR02983.1 ADP-ribosylation factor-related protein [Tieghemostelium lacteum]